MNAQAVGAVPSNGAGPFTTLDEVWSLSPLAAADADSIRLLINSSQLRRVGAGRVVLRADDEPRIFLLLDGLVRVMTSTAGGRRAAFRYAQTGDCLGLISSIVKQKDVEAAALTDSTLLEIDAGLVRDAARRSPDLSWALAVYASQTASIVMEIAGRGLFGSMPARVASHLLDMATVADVGLVVRASQWDIADSVGSVRDVVARAMNKLSHDGMIGRTEAGWLILDPAGLHRIAIAQTSS